MRRRKRTSYAPVTVPWVLSPVCCCLPSVSALLMVKTSTSGTGKFLVFWMRCCGVDLLLTVVTDEICSLPDVAI